MLRILSTAALAHNLHHTHTHTQAPLWTLLLCQGISYDQSQSFVSPGVLKKKKKKEVKTERRRITCLDSELRHCSWHSKKPCLPRAAAGIQAAEVPPVLFTVNKLVLSAPHSCCGSQRKADRRLAWKLKTDAWT